ncbi:MAG: D-alanyl-D-alanine carboxypeptidase/D-alanyl-D-alanine-endopeptidase [Bacteroidales bacterium]|nr:D-alanyl-D-alanine carboxypeptidase/D-alanyl-D-alanine-endopeptidase [Bacteroidales bacterium]
MAFLDRYLIACLAFISATDVSSQLNLSNEATVASVVIDYQTGNVVEEHDADRLLTPASLTKLMTTAAALDVLGPKTKFETRAFLDLDNSSLIIKGFCDPTMGSSYYTWHSAEAFADQIATALANHNVTRLNTLCLDASYIAGPTITSKRLWEDMGNYFGASPEAFNIYDNTATLILSSPSTVNAPCSVVGMQPDCGISVNCHVHSYTKNADSVYVYGYGDTWYASGAMPANKKRFNVKAAMPNPASFFARLIRKQIEAHGITIGKIDITLSDVNYGKTQLIATSFSPSVESIIKTTNHESVNLFADAMMLHLATPDIATDATTSIDKGMSVLRRFVESASGSKPHLYDGSGLSPMNALSPRQIASVVLRTLKSQYGRQYENSLATAGISGTLRRLGKGTPIEGKVVGKSGSMTGVLGYAGIINGTNGHKYVFCIIVNHYNTSSSEVRQQIASWLANYIK